MTDGILLGADYVRAVPPYVAGRPVAEVAREYGLDETAIVKLASNENPMGMPASAQAAIREALAQGARYPDANGFDLKTALAGRYGVGLDWITLGNGSNDILELAAHAFLQPGQSAVYSQYAFAVYGLATQAVGATSVVVPARNFGHDLDAMAQAIRPDTRVMFIANPNNPTGTFIEAAALEAFLDKMPRHIVVVLDEAYNEFLPARLQYESIAWVRRHPNLLVCRTFSKAYGLAGMRVGFAMAQAPVTELLNRIRQPFNVNALAQSAAVAALGDEGFLRRTAQSNAVGYLQLTQAFEVMGLEYVPSFGNFVLVRVGQDDGAGMRINLALLRQGVIVRPVNNYGLPQWLRISIGLPHENSAFLAALDNALHPGDQDKTGKQK